MSYRFSNFLLVGIIGVFTSLSFSSGNTDLKCQIEDKKGRLVKVHIKESKKDYCTSEPSFQVQIELDDQKVFEADCGISNGLETGFTRYTANVVNGKFKSSDHMYLEFNNEHQYAFLYLDTETVSYNTLIFDKGDCVFK